MHLGGLAMGSTKLKVGDLITVVDERNNIGIREFYGININKEFMPTVANTEGLDESKYKIINETIQDIIEYLFIFIIYFILSIPLKSIISISYVVLFIELI